MNIPYLDLEAYELEAETVKIIPVELALFHDIIAVDKIGKCLCVAIGRQDYFDDIEINKLREELQTRFKLNVQFVSALPEVIEEKIHFFYKKENQSAKI